MTPGIISRASSHPDCVIRGSWSSWSSSSSCSAQCRQSFARSCSNPRPVNSAQCQGQSSKSERCSTGACSPSPPSGTISGTAGNISSPGHPSFYKSHFNKNYTLSVPRGNIIEMKFLSFSVERCSSSCTCDRVSVVDADGTQLLKPSCGDTAPSIRDSNTNTAVVIFKTDYSVTRRGFLLEYKAKSARSSEPQAQTRKPKVDDVDQEAHERWLALIRRLQSIGK